MSEETMINKETADTTQPSKKKNIVFIIAAAAVVIVAVAVGIGIYNTPTNRLNRQLDLGNKYLEEQNYEQAAIEFEKAIEIDDRCVEAYAGGIKAYLGAGDIDVAKDFYDRTLTVLDGLDADTLAASVDYVVEIYLAADRVYGGDRDKIVQILEEGYAKTGENPQIKDKLIENYNPIAEDYTQAGSYEDALKVYDRLLELDNTNTETINGLCDCLNKYIAALMEAGKYDEIRALAEKYGDVATGVDFAGIIAQVEEIERVVKPVRDILVRIASLCEQENYEAVFEAMQSEEYAKCLEEVDKEQELIKLDTEYGKIGLYKVDTEYFGGYMIYYGEYADDMRHGEGVWMGYYDGNNYLAIGTWADDYPQGEFHVREWHSGLAEDVVYRVVSGKVDAGLWNGDVMWEFEQDGGIIRSFPVSFNNGKWVVLGYNEYGAIVSPEIFSQDKRRAGRMTIDSEHENNIEGIIGFGLNY